ncbi:MAG TPA: hypothetical protein LFW10_01445 [Rickettsia endosymbiont of Diachasma alloeum]|nr:hypothetical protein [Rickettsia endosymbiont of Diachasma alloeum]
MFIVHTETQGDKGVYPIYQEMKKMGYNVKVVVIPLYNGWYHLPYYMTIFRDVRTKWLNFFDNS